MSDHSSKPQTAPSSATPPKTAKLFRNGRSQAVRLPKEFRFEGNEVLVRRNDSTGEVILTPATGGPSLSFDEWFAMYDAIPNDAPAEQWAKLPPPPKNLTTQQLFRIFDRANYPDDFFERHTSVPRNLDHLF